jgi:hypothetical protein
MLITAMLTTRAVVTAVGTGMAAIFRTTDF